MASKARISLMTNVSEMRGKTLSTYAIGAEAPDVTGADGAALSAMSVMIHSQLAVTIDAARLHVIAADVDLDADLLGRARMLQETAQVVGMPGGDRRLSATLLTRATTDAIHRHAVFILLAPEDVERHHHGTRLRRALMKRH